LSEEETYFPSCDENLPRKMDRSARERALPVTLAADEARRLRWGQCAYCGTAWAGGIDRLDSTGGYVAGNVVSCCDVCNMMKKDVPPWYFVLACRAVAGTHDLDPERLLVRSAPRPLGRMTTDARRRGLAVTIGEAEYEALVTRPCTFCGLSRCGGVDRINGARGYEPGNVQPACRVCNLMKRTMSDAEFRRAAAAVARGPAGAESVGGNADNWDGFGLVTMFGQLFEVPVASHAVAAATATFLCVECYRLKNRAQDIRRGFFVCDACWAAAEEALTVKQERRTRDGEGDSRREASSKRRRERAAETK
jgi:hypothetical protein